MSRSTDQEHAFPHIHVDATKVQVAGGLTRRDYFTAKALQGLLSNAEWMKNSKGRMETDSVEEAMNHIQIHAVEKYKLKKGKPQKSRILGEG